MPVYRDKQCNCSKCSKVTLKTARNRKTITSNSPDNNTSNSKFICSFTLCTNPLVDNDLYFCEDHKCSYPKCRFAITSHENKYCLAHKCYNEHCDNIKQIESNYCDQHSTELEKPKHHTL